MSCPSSPHEERVGRGLRRGENPTRMPLLSPTLSSLGREEREKIDLRAVHAEIDIACDRQIPGK
jgi:hypothetical protein